MIGDNSEKNMIACPRPTELYSPRGQGRFFFFFLIYFLIGGKLLYNIVLVSAIQQYKSAGIMHLSASSWTFIFNKCPSDSNQDSLQTIL